MKPRSGARRYAPTMRIRAGVAVGLCVFVVMAGAACSSGSSSDGASPSSTPRGTLSSGAKVADYADAIARIKDQWGACLALVHETTAGAKMAPAVMNPKTGRRVRQDYQPVVVELASGEQFLVELAPGGNDGATPFNQATTDMLKAAKKKGGDCG